MRVSTLARIAVAASGVCLAVAGVVAGPARAAGGLAATTGSPAKAGSPATPGSAASPATAYYSVPGQLNGVAATSAASAWAVGYAGSSGSPKVLMLHWNGKAWSRVTSPKVLTGAGQLNAITVVNAKDAWAVGLTGTITNPHTLLLHWNGSAWGAVTRPAPIVGFLNAVTATASGGWAVGGVHNGHNFPLSLALRLSGSTWSRVAMPDALEVNGVAMEGAKAAWAIGDTEQQSELARWNGHTWTWEFSVLPVQDLFIFGGIASGPGGATFTVGWEYPSDASQVPVVLKLSGSTWKKVTVKAPSTALLNAVSFAPGGTVWAAGSTVVSTVILRWNGSAWTRVASPSSGTLNALDGLGFSSARDGWAVGTSGSDTLILHWNGSAWK